MDFVDVIGIILFVAWLFCQYMVFIKYGDK